MTTSNKPLCIIIDTNVWLNSSLLRVPIGSSLIYFALQNKAHIGLPEIIEMEIRKHATRLGKDAIEKIKENFDKLERLMGWRDDYRLPNLEELSKNTEARLDELGNLLLRIPITFEHMKAALDMVLEELPPNGNKKQQYKDSLIWQAILQLAQTHEMVFITEDKAFFEDREPKKGLALNLKADILTANGQVSMFYELNSYLKAVMDTMPPINESQVTELIDSGIRHELEETAQTQGFDLRDRYKANISAYLTEKSGVLSISYTITYNAEGKTENEDGIMIPALLIVEGSCYYNIRFDAITDVSHALLKIVDSKGESIPGKSIQYLYAQGMAFGGREPIQYRYREAL